MNKELCFVFGDRQLYMEQVLVEYDDIPIFYVCTHENEYYVVLRRDLEDEAYIVVRVTLKQLSDVLRGNLSMREIITKQKMFWSINAGEMIEDDIVEYKSASELPLQDLPYENSFFKIASKEHEVFAMELEQRLFDENEWEEFNQLFAKDVNEIVVQEDVITNKMKYLHVEVSSVEWALKIPVITNVDVKDSFAISAGDLLHWKDASIMKQSDVKIEIAVDEQNMVAAA